MEDKELIALLKKGDMDAFDRLYKKYERPLYNYIYRSVANKEDANDIFQEVFYKVIDKVKTLNHENFKSWLFKIAKNKIIDFYRKKKPINVENLQVSNLVNDYEAKDISIDIQKALFELKDIDRDIIILKYFVGYTFKDISEVLQVPLSTLLSKSRAILNKLKEILKGGDINVLSR